MAPSSGAAKQGHEDAGLGAITQLIKREKCPTKASWAGITPKICTSWSAAILINLLCCLPRPIQPWFKAFPASFALNLVLLGSMKFGTHLWLRAQLFTRHPSPLGLCRLLPKQQQEGTRLTKNEVFFSAWRFPAAIFKKNNNKELLTCKSLTTLA